MRIPRFVVHTIRVWSDSMVSALDKKYEVWEPFIARLASAVVGDSRNAYTQEEDVNTEISRETETNGESDNLH
jgi:fibrillarin-like rRNA methylase